MSSSSPPPPEKNTNALQRRDFLIQGAAVVGASALPQAQAQTINSAGLEVIDITPKLIETAQKEGTLTIRYSSPVDEMTIMADAFTAKYGIKCVLDRKVGVVGTQQFAAESRAKRHIMDINYTADPAGLTDLADEGFYLKFTLADLDKKLDKGAYIPGLGYSPKWTDIVISYNPSLIPHAKAQEMFKTWRGLLDPSLKGKIGINEPAGGGVPFANFLLFFRRPEYGRKFVEQLAAQQPRLYPGSAPGREDLASGAISVFIPNWESIAMLNFLKGDKTAWTYPEVAPAFTNTYFSISKIAPHPASSRLWTSWFFTPEGARVMHSAQARPTLKGVTDDRSAVAKLKQTSWWKPYPESVRWIPDMKDWDANYDTLMPEMRKLIGWRG